MILYLQWRTIFMVSFAILSNANEYFHCNSLEKEYGIVCVCSGDQPCGTIPNPKHMKSFSITTQNPKYHKGTNMMQVRELTNITIMRHISTAYKPKGNPILGFGGAFTDAAAFNLYSLSKTSQEELLSKYFSKTKGIGYKIGRVPIGSCDFSRRSYALHEKVVDYNITEFCLRDDRTSEEGGGCGNDYKLDLIKDAERMTQEGKMGLLSSESILTGSLSEYDSESKIENTLNGYVNESTIKESQQITVNTNRIRHVHKDRQQKLEKTTNLPHIHSTKNIKEQRNKNQYLKIFGSPWSAPPWMKTNNAYVGGALKLSQPEIKHAWATVLVKFIQEYQQNGVEIWGITPQNEPSQKVKWDSMKWDSTEMMNFIINYLGPYLQKLDQPVKLMIHDDALCNLESFAGEMLNNDKLLEFVDGIAYHWYNTLAGTVENSTCIQGVRVGGGRNVLNLATRIEKDNLGLFLLPTEACNGYFPFSLSKDLGKGPKLGNWNLGYRYARDILSQLKNNAVGWVDWNIWLDEQGGPNHAENFVDSPIIVSKEKDEFYLQSMYFHIAHFSKYIPLQSVQVPYQLSPSNTGMEAVAFYSSDEQKSVVVLLNYGSILFSRPKEHEVTIRVSGVKVSTIVPAYAIQTVVVHHN